MKTIAILTLALFTGCATSEPWRHARPSCLEYANAAFIQASLAGYEAGVAHCQLDGQPHAVTWITVDGERVYWDAAVKRYRSRDELGTVTFMTFDRPSLGAWEIVK